MKPRRLFLEIAIGAALTGMAFFVMSGLTVTSLGVANLVTAQESDNNATALCVVNRSGKKLFFAVRFSSNQRISAPLFDQQQLCLDGDMPGQKGTVSVFSDENAFEGCTRLTRAGTPRVLVDFVEFDNCTWAR